MLIVKSTQRSLKVTGNALNIEYYFWWCDYCFGLLIHHDAPFHFVVSISDEYRIQQNSRGENFRGFRGFCSIAKVFPSNISLH